MLYAVDQKASASEMQQWVPFMITAVELLPPTHGVSGLRAHLCKVPPCSWLAAEPARSLLQGRTGGDAAPGSPTRSGADPAGVQGLGALPVQAAPAGRNEWAVDSDVYHQCIGFWMLQSEQTIIRCVAAGEQKQGHGDAELLVNERHHSSCLGQPTGTNRPTKTLTRLSPAGPMVVQRK